MSHSSCSISGLFEPSSYLSAVFDCTTAKQSDKEIFGNPISSPFAATFIKFKKLDTKWDKDISLSGVFKNQQVLAADFSCVSEPDAVEEDHCGTLIFAQPCSSAHIVTIGL